MRSVPSVLLVLGLLAALPASASDLLRLLPGGQTGGTSFDHLKRLDDQRRLPGLRHQSQMSRHKARRDFNRAQAERALSAAPSVGPADRTQATLIRPTVFSYAAALQSVLQIARGDRVIFRTSARSGFLELERITSSGDRTCRHFRQEVRTPDGAEISYGSACRMRGGQWRYDFSS